MRVLLTGATGFLGRHVCAHLIQSGHQVVAAVRDPAVALRRFPGIEAVAIDLNRMTNPADWTPLLDGVDAVVNCAGILQSGSGQSAEAIHSAAPIALFEACLGHGIHRVVQISAVSADAAAATEYARTKLAADDYLRSLQLPWVVLRPSLVYANGSYGGTSVLRGLAGLPWVTPLIGDGGQQFQPIHASDLAETVRRCLEDPELVRQTLDAVGPETLTLRQLLVAWRTWLDLPPARLVAVPEVLVRATARLGDLVNAGPLRSTALDQMAYGNVSDPAAFEASVGFRPRSLAEALQDAPSHVQDRWHARLYFIRPLLTASLAVLWLGSGLAGLLNPPMDTARVTAGLGLPVALAPFAAGAFCLLDLSIGGLLAIGRGGRRLGLLQLGLVGGYTLGIGLLDPALWGDAYGPLLKNLPILAGIAAWMAMAEER